jgi:hypothetical protein
MREWISSMVTSWTVIVFDALSFIAPLAALRGGLEFA